VNSRTNVDDFGKESIDWAKQKYNHEIINLSDKEKAEIASLLKPMINGYIVRMNQLGLPGEQIIKKVYSFKEKYEKQYK
jgi:hypothetical protein